jgi:amino acid permease
MIHQACGRRWPSANLGPGHHVTGDTVVSLIVLLLASIGAALILGALTFVSALLGGLITAMIVLMCGPLIDRMVARRRKPTS